MKLRHKKTGEIIYAIFEQCEGNVKVINKDEPMKWGEYSSLKSLNEEWVDYEEPKLFYIVDLDGEIMPADLEDKTIERCKELGNYFDTREEAEKAVEKLKAWKRLKDKGFKFIPEMHRIEQGSDDRGNIIFIACTMNNEKDFIYGDNKDLKLLFGGEE